jgi:tetratricopeptide (TPR) repeat protein
MNFQGNSFIKSAYQRLAWISLIKADTNGYNNYLKRVQLFGNTSIDGDKQAEKEAQSKHIPNALLLKSRLLSDGGYYAKADNILSNLDNNHLKSDYEKLEYQYRISRNNHKWGKTNLAKTDYVKTILLGENQKWYFAANSALQLAIIYENEGNRDKAVQYYKKCLSMNYDEYRTSISQKAKAGLERVK